VGHVTVTDQLQEALHEYRKPPHEDGLICLLGLYLKASS